MTEQEKIEMLLRPRYKVIAEWFDSEWDIGDILNPKYKSGVLWMFDFGADDTGRYYRDENYLSKFPHLLKRLKWHEERKPEEMPQYVKGLKSVRKVIGIEHHTEEYLSILCEGDTVWCPIWMFLPALESEYLQYHAQKS